MPEPSAPDARTVVDMSDLSEQSGVPLSKEKYIFTVRESPIQRIPKSGSFIVSARHTGHLPGLLNFSRFRNTNPHLLHSAGVMTSLCPLLLTVLPICRRCAYISFSDIFTAADIYFMESGLPAIAEMISRRTVSCLPAGGGGCAVFFFRLMSVSGSQGLPCEIYWCMITLKFKWNVQFQ